MISRKLVLASLFALSVSAMGCTATVSAVPPPPPPPVEAEVTVEGEPPPPPPAPPEVIPAPPGPEFVWRPGFHRWVGGRYVWEAGVYMRRPRVEARWEPAHWEARGRVHVWVSGRWR
ncbi:MAG: YXWGXW repeat-containing protein [Polyangiaceae bacterium]